MQSCSSSETARERGNDARGGSEGGKEERRGGKDGDLD